MISANDGTVIPTPAVHAERLTETIRIALEVADAACQSDIEQWATELGERWYDTTPTAAQDDYEIGAIARARRYLSLRDRLEVDPVDVTRIRCKA